MFQKDRNYTMKSDSIRSKETLTKLSKDCTSYSLFHQVIEDMNKEKAKVKKSMRKKRKPQEQSVL